MSKKFVISECSADSSEETESTSTLTAVQQTNVTYHIPMDTLQRYESQDSDIVNLEVGDACKASYKRKEEFTNTKLNSLALFEEDMRMRPKV